MNYTDEIKIWESAMVDIVDIHHGMLEDQEITLLFENSLFCYVTGNGSKVSFDDNTYPIKSNALLHAGANTKITISSNSDETAIYYAVIYHASPSPNASRKLIADALRKSVFSRNYIFRTSRPMLFAEEFSAISNEWNNHGDLSALKIKELFYSLLYLNYEELSEHRNKSIDSDTFEYAYNYLKENYQQPVSIQTLCDSLEISRSTLHKQFRERIGLSPQQYLMGLRLEASCRLLESSTISIDEIAASCGLRDKSYFTKVFKDKYSSTPGEYRKEYANNKEKDTLTSMRISEAPNGGKATQRKPNQNEEYTLIESMGRIHRYFDVPKRIVCLDYAAAELCAAIGVADRITGVASAEESLGDCERKYRREISKAPFIQTPSPELNVPSFRSVCDCEPEIVIGTGYSFNKYGGVADAEEFENKGIHIFAAKATYTLDCSYESVYEDIRSLGKIFEREKTAEKIISGMMSEEMELKEKLEERKSEVRVFSFDTAVSNKAITCGQSIEKHIIQSAGGINVFGDRRGQFVSVDWHEVSEANPQVILVHSFRARKDGLQKIAFLKQIPEIAKTDAIRNDQIHIVGIKKVFPAIDNVRTALWLSDIFSEISEMERG